MIKRILLIISILLILSCGKSESISEIDGTWSLYNQKYILSDNVQNLKSDGEMYFSGSTPRLKDNGEYLFGSIKQTITVIPDKNYSLYISGILSSSKIWIDNSCLGEYGEIGYSLNESTPSIKRSIINFIPEKETIDIVIEFSNFHFKSKFLFKWIVYGESRDIIDLYIKNQSKDYFTTGLLIICSILFLLMFIINIKNKYNLYFALFTLSYGIRSYLMKNTTIQGILPWFTWTMEYQLNKASEIWALTFIILFLEALYPKEFRSLFIKIFTIIAFLSSFLAFIPLEYFNRYNILTLMHIEILISGVYIISRLIRSVRNSRQLSVAALISMALFFASIVFDIIANTTILLFEYYSAQFVIIVVVTMFMMMGKRISEMTDYVIEKQRINLDIKDVFSKFVPINILQNLNNGELEDRPAGEYTVEPLTMIFIDIRDFTKLSEGLSPQDNFTMINRFYDIVGSQVNINGGYIESYGGDGVKAIFQCAPDNAIKCAYNISDKVALSSGIKIGLSIHFGKVVLGTIGGEDRIQATAVSDVTRILGSMDQFNSKMGIEILITKIVYTLSTLTNDNVLSLGSIIIEGEDEPISLYQIIPSTYQIEPLFKEAFENAISMLKVKNYPKAYGYFALALQYNKSHQLTKHYLKEMDTFFKLRELTFTLKL